MRVVLVGASALTVATARVLLERKHEVVIIDKDEERIETLEQSLDCGFMHGDGSRPSMLKEVGPDNTDALLCLGTHDQDNIIAALVGKELEFDTVVAKIEDPEYESICRALGLSDTIVPDAEIGRSLADMVEGERKTSLSAQLKGDLRFLTFTASTDQAVRCVDLDLPGDTRVIALTRNEESMLTDDSTEIKEGDEVMLLTRAKHAQKLRERFNTDQRNKRDAD